MGCHRETPVLLGYEAFCNWLSRRCRKVPFNSWYPLVSISVNFPISVNRNSGFFSLSEQKNGSKNEILVDLSLPLISMSFWDSSQQSARLSRNVCVRCRNIHREMNCARCAAFQSAKTCIDSFWMARRIKSYKAFSEPLFEQNFGILK